jgi:hypothetical protein
VGYKEYNFALEKLRDPYLLTSYPDTAFKTILVLETIPTQESALQLLKIATTTKMPKWIQELALLIKNHINQQMMRSDMIPPSSVQQQSDQSL